MANLSLRQTARILGISPAYLSLLLNGKRPWRGNLKERYAELVNTFVNTNGGQSEIEEERNLNSIPKMMVSRQGFEPWTLGLKVRCSTRLSYRPVHRLAQGLERGEKIEWVSDLAVHYLITCCAEGPRGQQRLPVSDATAGRRRPKSCTQNRRCRATDS